MKAPFALFAFGATAVLAADAYYNLAVYSPDKLQLDGKVINAVDSDFIIGALRPSTNCDLFDPSGCPAGNSTLVNEDMTALAVGDQADLSPMENINADGELSQAAVPGGQFIFVSPDGSITYSAAHSTRRPAGAQMGGFSGFQVIGTCDPSNPISVFTWQSEDGATGLWACQVEPGVPIGKKAVLKASTKGFGGAGCLGIQALQIHEVGKEYAAWQYT